MATALNEVLLDQALSQLESARPWSPRVISKLEAHLHTAEDRGLFRVNPILFGKEKGIAEEEAITLLLHAAKVGLFEMEWHLVCPLCSQYVSSFSSLKHVQSSFRCATCHVDGTATLDDYIEITFTLSPSIRRLVYHDPDRLSPLDYLREYRWAQGARFSDGGLFIDMLTGTAICVDYVDPGETKTYTTTLARGILTSSEVISHGEFVVVITGEPVQELQRIVASYIDGHVEIDHKKIAPGPCEIVITNSGAHRAAIEVHQVADEYIETMYDEVLVFPEFLTGTRLIMNQTFRDLFTAETINPTSGLGVKSVSILFTDLKGSTELYDRIGDLEAFALIQQHFDRLGAVIRDHGGIVIKTIGDAIMASFMRPSDAVLAAIAILTEVDSFNEEHHAQQIILKLGVHTGASIAVTLNERLDYFGQTVNIASRVEGLANANEIVITEEVFRSPGVADIIASYRVHSGHAQLKGVQKGHLIHRITLKDPSLLESAS